MRIAFVHAHPIKVITDGVRSQALSWKQGLESLGHEVILVNMWEKNNWKSYDVVQFFSFGEYMNDLIYHLTTIGVKISVAPIFDPYCSMAAYKLYARWGCNKLRLTNSYHQFRCVRNLIDLCLVRSKFEKRYVINCFDISPERCRIVPLSFNINPIEASVSKENFCLHISLLVDERKNVKRLIDAAKKYKFKLVLGGFLRNEEEYQLLMDWIENADNVEYVGFLSEEEKVKLYARAKVFALPSVNEGVGLVALEAAAMGCDIVITSWGGPKEYYNGMAKIVNPYNMDEIGKAVTNLLEGETYQLQLKDFVIDNYSQTAISEQLENAYISIIS
jgi:glycosyltransferase involved in cell wall biosynthesis